MTDHVDQTKKNYGQTVFPEVAFLDPKYTYDMPISVTINTAVDAFSHLGEGYLGAKASPFSDSLAEKGFELFAACIPALLKGEVTHEDRKSLMEASTLGGMVIAQTGTSLPHGMGYAMTYNKHVPHGMANGQLFAAFLKAFKDQSKVMKMLNKMGFETIEAFESVLKQLIPVTVTLTEEEIETFTKGMTSNQAKLKNHPETVSDEEISGIYKQSYGA
jgi:alcohol dehydrogenase